MCLREILLQEKNACPMVVIRGDLKRDNVDRLKGLLEEAYNSKSSKIYVDFSASDFIDSICLGYLVYFHTYLANMGKELVIFKPSEEVELLLGFTGLERLFSVEY